MSRDPALDAYIDARADGAGGNGKPTTQGAADPFAAAISLADLDRQHFREPEMLVPNLLPLGGTVLLASPPKLGKSYLANSVGLAVAQNGFALGMLRVNYSGPVLMISLDDTSLGRAQFRARQINYGKPLPALVTLLTDATLGRGEQARDNLRTYLRRRGKGTVLVIVDTLAHLRPPRGSGENPYDADVSFMAILRTLCAEFADMTLLCLTHTRKMSADDGVAAVSGTYGVAGGADAIITMEGTRHAPGRSIEVVSRDSEGGEYALKFGDHGLVWTPDIDPHDPALHMGEATASVFHAVVQFGTEVTANDLALLLPNVPAIGNKLAALAKAGAIRKISRGKYIAF